MASIAVAPVVLKDVVLTVGTDSYEAHVSSVKFTPSTNTLSWKGLTPSAVFTDVTAPTWTCTITYAQDWVTTNSLANYLLTNAGQQKAVVFKPQGAAAGKPSFAATLTITPGDIGGDVDQWMTATVTLGVVGVPVKTLNP